MKFNRYITEKIEMTGEKQKDKWLKEIEKWKSDLRKMTKIYKSIPSEDTPKAKKMFKEARKLFVIFRINWEKWYTQFIKDRYIDGQSNKEDYYSKEARVTSWQAEMAIGSLFPNRWDYKTKKDVDAPWELDSGYRKGDTRKNKIIVYQKAFKKAFDSIEELIKYRFEYVSANKIDQINVAGVNVIITTDQDTGDYTRKGIKMFIDILPEAVKRIKKSGFGQSLKGLTVKLKMESGNRGDGSTAGEYFSYDDTLAIYKWGLTGKTDALRVLVHEMGHRYFKRLSKKAQDAWGDAIHNSFINIESKDIKKFIDNYIGKYPKNDEGKWSIKKADRIAIEKEIKNNERNPDTRAKMLFMIRNNHGLYTTEDRLRDEFEGERIHREMISDYARKNTEEAFCEAFAFWVIKPNHLGSWTKSFFKEIVRSGGMDIKEEKNMKIIEKIDKYLKEGASASDIENYILDEFSGKTMSKSELFKYCASEIRAKKYEFQVAFKNLTGEGEIKKVAPNQYKIG
jgi:hypothetical protein